MAEGRIRGSVKRMERVKGFGFIVGENGRDYFFHATSVDHAGGLDALQEGDEVSFIAESTAKGPRALQVRLVADKAAHV
jgi:CspA family cold shock protein